MGKALGPEVPLHFSAFHPDFKMGEVPSTPPATLVRARRIALAAGLRYVYTGNVHDTEGDTTPCPGCGAGLIVRDWYEIRAYRLAAGGACPDCGRKQMVPARVKPKPKRSPMTSDAETPMLDAASALTTRPSALSPEARRKIYEDERDSEYGRALAESRRTGKPMEIDVRGRPILPRWPLVTGVWRMIVTEEVISRWILSSIVLGLAGQFLGEALLTPLQGMAEAIKLIFTVVGGMLAALWLAMIAPFMVVIVGETADGHNKVHQPPRLVAFDWFNELFSVVFAGSVAGLCGLGVSQLLRLTPLEPTVAAAIVAAVVMLVLPFALLSTLLEGSAFGVLSPRLFRSLWRCAGAWLLFYVETFALAVLAGGAAWMISRTIQPAREGVTALVWCLAPLGIAALFIDMRLLGRLAGLIVERMPEEGDERET